MKDEWNALTQHNKDVSKDINVIEKEVKMKKQNEITLEAMLYYFVLRSDLNELI